MWHEARRQEKLVRIKMVDNVKRHERRKIFYESIRRDPEEFMQIHGRRATIHMDASVAAAAEGTNILRKWQGDPDVLIDRFDVRAHLDYIPEPTERTNSSAKQLLLDDAQELQCEYERYRILIFNEYLKVSERNCLNQIAAKEFWPSMTAVNIHKMEIENKKKAVEKKAAIGFTYADSTVPSSRGDIGSNGKAGATNSESDSDSSDDVEIDDIDMKFDVEEITPEQGAMLNKIGARYRIGGGVFLKLMRLDYKEQDNNAQIKEIDKAKLALSGRQAKADRAALKRRRAMIVGKVTQNEEATTTLLSFLANTKKNSGDNLTLSSSESESDDVEKTEFITSIGGEDDDSDRGNRASFSGQTRHAIGYGEASADGNRTNDDDDSTFKGVVQGPVLPTKEYRRLWELKRRRSNSAEEFKNPFGSTRRCRSRSHSRSRSYERNRRDDRTSKRRRTSHSRSPGDSLLTRDRHRSERSARSRRSRSRSRSYDRKRDSGRRTRDDRRHTRRSTSTSSNSSHGSSFARTRRESSVTSNGGSASGSDSPLTIRSSMSESEKEQLEIENRKRRIRRIKREVKNQGKSSARQAEEEKKRAEESDRQKAGLAKKLRHQMQKTLKKTAEQLKQEEEEKAREQFKERKQREEELLEEARILRMREREKLRQEDERAAANRERERLQRRAEREATERLSRTGSRRYEDVKTRGRDSSRSCRRRRSSS